MSLCVQYSSHNALQYLSVTIHYLFRNFFLTLMHHLVPVIASNSLCTTFAFQAWQLYSFLSNNFVTKQPYTVKMKMNENSIPKSPLN